MSKKIFSIGLTIVGIVLALPTVGASLGLSTLAIAGIEVGIALTQSLLLGPSIPKGLSTSPTDRLYANLDTTTPRKMVLGDTAGATDIRYQSYTGSRQEYYHQMLAVASHQVNEIYEVWIENELAWNSAAGTDGLGRYSGYLSVSKREVGNSADYIAIDSNWGVNCTLTGVAWLYLRFKLVGPDNSTPSPFQGGTSGRLTVRTRGALVYDPRLDSTVSGGSGAHRADDQTTWTWDSNASRNPALQLLWYLLGWKIGGKLAVGMGLPKARIDLASFIAAANICDESVVLAAGGTQPRYRADGVLSEGDDRQGVIETLCATMNAMLRDGSGKIALQVLRNDLATPVADFTDDDILGGEEWNQTPALSQYFNIVRGRCVDPSNAALYQLTDYPSQSLTSPDGIDRIQPLDFVMIQAQQQAQRLAKQRLIRAQFQGRYSAVFGPRAYQVSVGDVVRQSHRGLSWTNKLFRVVAQQITRTGSIRMTLLEEDASIYAWTAGSDEKAGIAVTGTPVVYNPANNPLLPGTSALTELIKTSYCTAAITIRDNNTFDVTTHTRVYSDKSVSVTGASGVAFTGTAGQVLGIYYDDAARAGGAVTYHGIAASSGVSSDCFPSSANPYRHFVGYGTIPTTGSTSTGTGSTGGTGYGGVSGGVQP